MRKNLALVVRAWLCVCVITCQTIDVQWMSLSANVAQTSWFTSLNYPDVYHNYMQYTWQINAPTGYVIELTVVDFEIEFQWSSCNYDIVVIYDGLAASDEQQLVRHCGTAESSATCGPYALSTTTFHSTSNIMTVYFKTDLNIECTGFNMTYRAVLVDVTTAAMEIEMTTLLETSAYPSTYVSRNPGLTTAAPETSPNPTTVVPDSTAVTTAHLQQTLSTTELITCQSLPVWLDVEFSNYDTDLGMFVTYMCKKRHQFEDDSRDNSKSSQCDVISGHWSPAIVGCVRVLDADERRELRTPTEAEHAVEIGLPFILLALGIEAATIVLLDLSTCCKYCEERHKRIARRKRSQPARSRPISVVDVKLVSAS